MHDRIRRLFDGGDEQAWITGRGPEQRLAIGRPGTDEWVASRVAIALEEVR